MGEHTFWFLRPLWTLDFILRRIPALAELLGAAQGATILTRGPRMARCALARSGLAMILVAMMTAAALAATTCGGPVPAPKYEVGEKWTWRGEKGQETTDEVIQVDGDTTQIRQSNGDVAFLDTDRILRKVKKMNGEVVTTQGAGAFTTIGKKVLDFPLQMGKKWEYSYSSAPANNLWGMQTYINSYEVVACEEVTTPAGKFSAIKIEAYQRIAGRGAGGTYYIWYAPEMKTTVRREYVLSNYWTTTYGTELIKYERK